jgi:sugar lactone lactonase YvrE
VRVLTRQHRVDAACWRVGERQGGHVRPQRRAERPGHQRDGVAGRDQGDLAGQVGGVEVDAGDDAHADGGLHRRRVFADGVAPDGICLDAEGAVWSSAGPSVVRVAAGGEVLQRVGLRENRAPFALMLGGPGRRTLFILTAEWRPGDGPVANLDRLANGPRTGEILALPVAVPGAGRP